MQFLHSHNVKGFVTLNTLIFSDELPAVAEFVKRCAECGVDAVIVQDLGLVALIKRIAPTLAVHASTQMTLTEPRGIAFVRNLGVERVVLARELSLDDIRKVTAADRDAGGGLRPRRALRRLLRAVPDQRGARRPQRQPRPVCPGVPAALRDDRGRRSNATSATARTCSARRTSPPTTSSRRSSTPA